MSHNAQAQAQQAKANVLNHPYVQQARGIVQGQVQQLDKTLSAYPTLNNLERQTRIPKAYGALGLGATFLAVMFLNVFGLAQPMSNLVGWLGASFFSCRALESPGHDDDLLMLSFWTIFGLLNFIESAGLRLVLYYLPYYFVLKTVFTVWLMHPQFRGGEVMYRNVVRPAYRAVHSSLKSAQSGTHASTAGYRTSVPASATSATSTSFEHEKTL